VESINHRELVAQLVRRGISQEQFAMSLGKRPSTFSAWIRGVNPAPEGFRENLEDELGLRRGALRYGKSGW
jgi:transcriptional regulator with XRE-family HTH domain